MAVPIVPCSPADDGDVRLRLGRSVERQWLLDAYAISGSEYFLQLRLGQVRSRGVGRVLRPHADDLSIDQLKPLLRANYAGLSGSVILFHRPAARGASGRCHTAYSP